MANETLHDERVLTRAEILRTVERTRQARGAQIDAGLRQSAERRQLGKRVSGWWNRLETVLGRPAVTSSKHGWLFLVGSCLVLPLTVPALLIAS